MHYSICTPADDAASSILADALAALSRDKQMQADRTRLDPACCAPQERAASK
jgi:hypothetical protein